MEERLPRWRVMAALKDSGWPTDSYHRIYINAVVSGSEEQVSIRRLCFIKLQLCVYV